MEKFDLKQLLENKPLLYTIIGAVAIVLVMFFIMIAVIVSSGSKKDIDPNATMSKTEINNFNKSDKELIKEDMSLFVTENIGKALEVQALWLEMELKLKKLQTDLNLNCC